MTFARHLACRHLHVYAPTCCTCAHIREDFKSGQLLLQAVESGLPRPFARLLVTQRHALHRGGFVSPLRAGPAPPALHTLMIGIVTTVFTAYRAGLDGSHLVLRRRRPCRRGVRFRPLRRSIIRFMRLRNFNFGLSAMLSVASVVGFMTMGMNLGIDFTGGSIFQVKAIHGEANLEQLRDACPS